MKILSSIKVGLLIDIGHTKVIGYAISIFLEIQDGDHRHIGFGFSAISQSVSSEEKLKIFASSTHIDIAV